MLDIIQENLIEMERTTAAADMKERESILKKRTLEARRKEEDERTQESLKRTSIPPTARRTKPSYDD